VPFRTIRRILDILPDIAASESSVLIEGPTGTGKELFAKAIHDLSARSEHKYVAVNCGALPDTLLESELFGYKKGAFTDARHDKPGRFALAEGGTLFLDEISDISTALQVKLLRVLEAKEYEPLGATKTVKANVRVITATNKPLIEQVNRGTFRDDLYYRLNVVRVVLPRLAERREDIPLLVNHFISRINAEQGKQFQGFSEDAMALLMNYEFPGNIRELQNIVERAAILCRGDWIEAECLPAELLSMSFDELQMPSSPSNTPLGEAESATIVRALRDYTGHRGMTAAALGIDKSTLWRKMKKYAIDFPSKT
jgi:transcriptional regulator with PAS, ATPase and Fis domain